MQDAQEQIKATGAHLVAISGDAQADADALVEKLGLTFPVVSDTDLKLTAAFGLRQEDKESPLPSTYVLDGQGRVLWSVVGQDIVTRPTIDEVLSHVR